MWAIIFKWAAIVWPVVWRYVKPLLEKSALNTDLQWILPIAESIVGIVERTSLAGTPGSSKAGRAYSMIVRALKDQDPIRAAKISERTIRKAIELALDVAPETAKIKPPNVIPASVDGIEQSGTQVSP